MLFQRALKEIRKIPPTSVRRVPRHLRGDSAEINHLMRLVRGCTSAHRWPPGGPFSSTTTKARWHVEMPARTPARCPFFTLLAAGEGNVGAVWTDRRTPFVSSSWSHALDICVFLGVHYFFPDLGPGYVSKSPLPSASHYFPSRPVLGRYRFTIMHARRRPIFSHHSSAILSSRVFSKFIKGVASTPSVVLPGAGCSRGAA